MPDGLQLFVSVVSVFVLLGASGVRDTGVPGCC